MAANSFSHSALDEAFHKSFPHGNDRVSNNSLWQFEPKKNELMSKKRSTSKMTVNVLEMIISEVGEWVWNVHTVAATRLGANLPSQV